MIYLNLSRFQGTSESRSNSLAQTITRSLNVIINPKRKLIFQKYKNVS